MSGSGDLPFTGSIFTLPLIVIGLVLTLSSWAALKFKQDGDASS